MIANLVNELLGCLCQASVFEELHKDYLQYLNNLILDVCFMLIRTSTDERQKMYAEPQEFVNLALDTCEEQKSKTVKTQAAKLFEALVDNINGSLTLTTFYSLQFINKKLSLSSGKAELDMRKLTETLENHVVNMVDECAMMKNSQDDVVVESALLVIGLLSYVHAKKNYAELCEQMNSVLAYYSNALVNSASPLVRVRYA